MSQDRSGGHFGSEINIEDRDGVIADCIEELACNDKVTAAMAGFFNFFLTVKVIKEAKGINRLPAVAVVIMTILFPLELLISCVFVVPNIIIFGIVGIKKDKS